MVNKHHIVIYYYIYSLSVEIRNPEFGIFYAIAEHPVIVTLSYQ